MALLKNNSQVAALDEQIKVIILFELFCFVLFCFILFYFILFYFILFYFILFYFILFYFILFCFVCLFVSFPFSSIMYLFPPPQNLNPKWVQIFFRNKDMYYTLIKKSTRHCCTLLGSDYAEVKGWYIKGGGEGRGERREGRGGGEGRGNYPNHMILDRLVQCPWF